MAGTTEGGKKAYKKTMETKGKDFIRKSRSKAGSKGKKDGVLKGYAVRTDLASINGRKGAEARWGKKLKG